MQLLLLSYREMGEVKRDRVKPNRHKFLIDIILLSHSLHEQLLLDWIILGFPFL